MRVRRGAGWVALAVAVLGCASAQRATPEMDVQAKSFAPVTGKARIYIVRPGTIPLRANAIQAHADGREITSLTADTYFVYDLEPGEHIIAVGMNKMKLAGKTPPPSPGYMKLTLAAGSVTYLTAPVGMNRIALAKLDDAQGQAAVTKATLVVSTHAEGRTARFYPPGDEVLRFGFEPDDWPNLREESGRNTRTVVFRRADTSAAAPDERIRAETLRRSAFPQAPNELIGQMHAEDVKSCPAGFNRRTIAEGGRTEMEDTTVVYEWSVSCASPGITAVSKILYGQFNIFRVTYITSAGPIAPEKRSLWITQLNATRIVRSGR